MILSKQVGLHGIAKLAKGRNSKLESTRVD